MYKKSWKYMNEKHKQDQVGPGAPVGGTSMAASTGDMGDMVATASVPASIPELDILVDVENCESGVKDVLKHIRPDWNRDDITIKTLSGGHVNMMFTAFVDEEKQADWLVVRVFSGKLDVVDKLGMDRKFELKSGPLFAQIGAGPPVKGVFRNGMVYGFVNGKTFSWQDQSPFKDVKLRRSVARSLALINCQETKKLAISMGFDKAPLAYDIMANMGSNDWGDAVLVDEETTKWFNSQVPSFEDRKQEMSMIIDKMKTASIPWTFCHIDCNPTNIIYLEEEDKIIFVDLEACGICNPIMDIANFLDGAACGFDGDPTARGFTREEKKDFMRAYLAERNRLDKGSEEVDENELEKYLDITEMYQIGSCFMVHILMAMLAMAGMPIQYLQAGVRRLEHYKKNKDRMLSLHS